MAESEKRLNHVGVIMDGNRRWAKQHKFETVIKGHEKGVDKFMELCMWCQERAIKHLTVYAFSYDNWNRTNEEVDGLMDLMERFFTSKVKTCINRGIRLVPIGNFSLMKDKIVLFHLKDYIVENGTLKQVGLGKGLMDYKFLIKTIKENFDDAYLIFEGVVGDDIEESLEFINNLLNE